MFRYAQYGDVSPKIDVYAFGVVLYELISAKEAIVKENGSAAESKGLVGLVTFLLPFQPSLNQSCVRSPLNISMFILVFCSTVRGGS